MMLSGPRAPTVRTTIDIPDRDHALFMSLARAQGTSLGKLLVELARRGIKSAAGSVADGQAAYTVNPATGLPLFRSGQPVTIDDVKALEDEDDDG
jgi:hypothetical protein